MNGWRITAYFDGSFKKGYGIGGWYIKITNNDKLFASIKNSTYTKVQDSIMAEYIGLIGLLEQIKKYVKDIPIKQVKIYGDCQGVILRIKNKCRNRLKYNPYNQQVKDLVNEINKPIIFKKINRKENKVADKICRKLIIVEEEIKVHQEMSKQIDELPEHIKKLRKVNKTSIKFKPTPEFDRVTELLKQVSGD